MRTGFLAILLVLQLVVIAQIPALDKWCERISKDPAIKGCTYSLCVKDLSSGNTLEDYNAQLLLTPASCLKLLTTAAALAKLGEDFTFKTNCSYSGTISKEGILIGDIMIHGSGDPTLASSAIENGPTAESIVQAICDTLKQLGIREIKGRVIVLTSIFKGPEMPGGWSWSDMGNYYGAAAGGFNFRDNRYSLFIEPDLSLCKAHISKVDPDLISLRLQIEMTLNDTIKDEDVIIYGSPYDYGRELYGSIPSGRKMSIVKGSMPDPAMYFAQLLTLALNSQGIAISSMPATSRSLKEEGTKAPADGVLFYSITSPSLQRIISETNLNSINLYAEALLKAISAYTNGSGTSEDGMNRLKTFIDSLGLDSRAMILSDACGLSRTNAVSADQFTSFLSAYSRTSFYPVFKNSLPLSGRSGTLIHMGDKSPAEGKIRAKSGTLSNAISYAGYVRCNSGKSLSFAVMFNNYTCENQVIRKQVEQLFNLLVDL